MHDPLDILLTRRTAERLRVRYPSLSSADDRALVVMQGEVEAATWGWMIVAFAVPFVVMIGGFVAFLTAFTTTTIASGVAERFGVDPAVVRLAGSLVPMVAAVITLVLSLRAYGRIRDRLFREIYLRCCPACGYDLTGNQSGVCPECGRAVGAVDTPVQSPP